MAIALIRVEAGTATIYGSGPLPSLLDVGGLSSIVVTRTQGTPAGDPVQVDLSSFIGQLRGDCSITVKGGATVYVGGGLVNLGLGNALTLDGGRLVIRSSLLSASAVSSITVGPNAGELRIEPQGFGVRLDVPVNFVDEQGRATTRIPPNFVMDFPNTQFVGAVYDLTTNRTTIGDGVDALGIVSIGRTTTLKGDPFNLRANGKPQKDFWGNITGYGYNFTRNNGHDDGRGGVITCYLPGSLVRTDTGAVPVETLAVGDSVPVFTVDGQSRGLRQVTWVGQGHVTVQPELPDDEAGWPVCIRQNALADNVPCRDMLVTSEHCLLLDGHFIPVRMLVNGSSIFYDRSHAEYDYWHF
ncbi:Hint domain-containing protein [Bombella sp. TMW 2.2559]|uniref:Hint domain-containing protein n=1 Tax=Bombella dulcis TaxID=2967339 RepID=A0ABT3WDK7_9PROT|nr:Hint domain-containing protein [Bombella dulcis]MCX5616459.1 Hint domain-containing protein [Bombella dulcis]